MYSDYLSSPRKSSSRHGYSNGSSRNSRPRSGSYSSRGRSYGGGRSRYGRNKPKSSGASHDKYIAKAQVVEQKAYTPQNTFAAFDLNPIIKANVARKGYTIPTPIQDQSIPHILEGKDVLGLASTGSGKTAAFLLPLINKTIKDRNQKVLIVVPTRELAAQIREELFDFTEKTFIRSVLVIGGAGMSSQISNLRRDPQFVIGTPGRLVDLVNRKALKLEGFNNVVLDEVDRMLDMGFINDIKFLIGKLNKTKQSLFFSATMNKEASTIANAFLKDPVKVEIESQGSSKNVDQDIVKVPFGKSKVDILHDLLISEGFAKVLIFSRTKRGSDQLMYELKDRGFKVDAIHGDKSQFIRNKVISKFKTNQINILVATDVAARGLDIPDITHVINYDEPENYEDYIHRIGRTGRAGKKGKALTFVK